MKCSVCQFGIRNERYVFCPMCGSNIQGDEFPFVKLNYLWERDRQGIFLYDNFKLIRETGLRALVKKPPVREKLGDWSSILMLGLRRYSLLQLNPDFNRELYTMSKLLGYFSGEIYLKVTHLDSIAKRLASTGLFWKVFEHKKLIDKYCLGWKNLCAAEIKLKDINRENHTLTYTLNEDANYFLKSEKPLCSVELGAISGHTEVFFDGFASGKETLCQSTKHKLNEFRIEYSQEEKEPILPETTKEEYSRVLDQAID